MGGTLSLEELRKRIDDIDRQLVGLMSERARLAVQIGQLKRENGQESVYSPEREREVLEHVVAANNGPLGDATLIDIWKELMSGSLSLEKAIKVVFLGPEGSFSHLAALEKFGRSVELIAVRDIATVFDHVARASADYGIVPVENTTGGAVRDTMDSFMWVRGPVKICAEMALPVHQNLLSKTTIDRVKKVYSKPQVFDQCRQWLCATCRRPTWWPSARRPRRPCWPRAVNGTAAIASSMAAELYGLTALNCGHRGQPAEPDPVPRPGPRERQAHRPRQDVPPL